MRLGVMQPEQVDAVVVAVRRSHDCMDVELRRFSVGKKNARMVVEFDEDHRALNPVVERTVLFEAADPAEMSLVEMTFDLIDSRGERTGGNGAR